MKGHTPLSFKTFCVNLNLAKDGEKGYGFHCGNPNEENEPSVVDVFNKENAHGAWMIFNLTNGEKYELVSCNEDLCNVIKNSAFSMKSVQTVVILSTFLAAMMH